MRAAVVRADSAAVDVRAYTTTRLGRIPFEGRVQHRDGAWQLTPRAHGAMRFSLPDSELVAVDVVAGDSKRPLVVIGLAALAVAGIALAVGWIGLGVSSR